jgi:hypothetical protein
MVGKMSISIYCNLAQGSISILFSCFDKTKIESLVKRPGKWKSEFWKLSSAYSQWQCTGQFQGKKTCWNGICSLLPRHCYLCHFAFSSTLIKNPTHNLQLPLHSLMAKCLLFHNIHIVTFATLLYFFYFFKTKYMGQQIISSAGFSVDTLLHHTAPYCTILHHTALLHRGLGSALWCSKVQCGSATVFDNSENLHNVIHNYTVPLHYQGRGTHKNQKFVLPCIFGKVQYGAVNWVKCSKKVNVNKTVCKVSVMQQANPSRL